MSNDTFRDSGKNFDTLDLKLAGLFQKAGFFPKQLTRKITRLQEKEMQEHTRVLNGRQLLYQICLYLRTGAGLRTFYNIEQLTEMKWLGDSYEQISKFTTDWLSVTTGMRSSLEDAEFAELLSTRMRQSGIPSIKTTCEMYRRASHDTPYAEQHTYQFLLDSLEHYMDDILEDRNVESNRAEFRRTVGGGRDQYQSPSGRGSERDHKKQTYHGGEHAYPAETGGGGKDKGKGGGKDRKGKDRGKDREAKGKGGGKEKEAKGKGGGKGRDGGKDQGVKGRERDGKGKGGEKGKNTAKLEDFKRLPSGDTKNLCKFHFTYQGCARKAQGLCNREHPMAASGKPKQLCLYYQGVAGCTQKNCQRLHELIGQESALWLTTQWELHAKRRTEVCAAYQNGQCRYGDRCSYKHSTE